MELRLSHRLRRIAIVAFASVVAVALAVPADAEDTAAAATRSAAAKRTATSFATGQAGSPTRSTTNFANGFLYLPGAQSGLDVGGRVPVGKSHVYVPYYGNVSNDPTHPGVQGTAGIAYGFRTWDISVLNGGLGPTAPTLPGVDPPKANPSLSVSIRF